MAAVAHTLWARITGHSRFQVDDRRTRGFRAPHKWECLTVEGGALRDLVPVPFCRSPPPTSPLTYFLCFQTLDGITLPSRLVPTPVSQNDVETTSTGPAVSMNSAGNDPKPTSAAPRPITFNSTSLSPCESHLHGTFLSASKVCTARGRQPIPKQSGSQSLFHFCVLCDEPH